jgi:hypothetical protein
MVVSAVSAFAAAAESVPVSLYDHAEPIALPELIKSSSGQVVTTKEDWNNFMDFADRHGWCR